MAERISKRLAHAGIASRREAERLILDGRVEVNGETLTTPAVKVDVDDVVKVDGERIGERPGLRVWKMWKLEGTVVTRKDERGRSTVFDILPEDMPHVVAVGRLAMNSEGLLLLANAVHCCGSIPISLLQMKARPPVHPLQRVLFREERLRPCKIRGDVALPPARRSLEIPFP